MTQRQSTPTGEEDEGTPVVGCFKERGNAKLDAIDEEPMEGLTQGSAEWTNPIRPELTAEYVDRIINPAYS